MSEVLNQPALLNTRYYSDQYNEHAETLRRVASVSVNALILITLIAPHLHAFPAGSLAAKIANVSKLVNGVRVLPEIGLWITGQAWCETDVTTGIIEYQKDGWGRPAHAKKRDALWILQNYERLRARVCSGALLLDSLGFISLGIYSQPMVTSMFFSWATVIGIAVCQAPDIKSLWLEAVALPCDFYLSDIREMEIVSRSIVILNDANWTVQYKIIPWLKSNA